MNTFVTTNTKISILKLEPTRGIRNPKAVCTDSLSCQDDTVGSYIIWDNISKQIIDAFLKNLKICVFEHGIKGDGAG